MPRLFILLLSVTKDLDLYILEVRLHILNERQHFIFCKSRWVAFSHTIFGWRLLQEPSRGSLHRPLGSIKVLNGRGWIHEAESMDGRGWIHEVECLKREELFCRGGLPLRF